MRAARSSSIADRLDEISVALLSLSHDDLAEPHRSWLRAQYRRIVPVVLADALHAVEHGTRLPERCLAPVRGMAAECRAAEVPLGVVLRGQLPAITVFARFLFDGSHQHLPTAVLMVRACLVAQELASVWVESWLRARAATSVEVASPEVGAGPVDAGAGSDGVEAVDALVLALVAGGSSNAEIALSTNYSRQAVAWRLSRLMHRWRVPNRAALVAAAFARGVLPVRGRR